MRQVVRQVVMMMIMGETGICRRRSAQAGWAVGRQDRILSLLCGMSLCQWWWTRSLMSQWQREKYLNGGVFYVLFYNNHLYK